jgi:hypothetical protein
MQATNYRLNFINLITENLKYMMHNLNNNNNNNSGGGGGGGVDALLLLLLLLQL